VCYVIALTFRSLVSTAILYETDEDREAIRVSFVKWERVCYILVFLFGVHGKFVRN
jgi:hypothetical protein